MILTGSFLALSKRIFSVDWTSLCLSWLLADNKLFELNGRAGGRSVVWVFCANVSSEAERLGCFFLLRLLGTSGGVFRLGFCGVGV